MLYLPERHEPLAGPAWDEQAARRAIAEIVADTEAHFDPVKFWPAHPREDLAAPGHGLYLGTAGIVWALHRLKEAGTARIALDYAAALERAYEAHLARPEERRALGASYLFGDSGILLVMYRVMRSPQIAERLYRVLADTPDHPTNELMWGSPGTALAAIFMWEATHDERWRDQFLTRARDLWSAWRFDVDHDCYLWEQVLYQPQSRIFLGPVHGFAGNVCVLLRGASLLDEPQREELYDRAWHTIDKTAHIEGDSANWHELAAKLPPDAPPTWLVQWCHGAPGTLGAIAAIPRERSSRLESLFLAGGDLTWRAGPLLKGPNVCHGTGGNGYLFLKLYRRIGDAQWLDRARAFAMHGIEQWRAMNAKYGRGWYSLWTGDLGFAVYLWDCINGGADFPTMDVF